MVQIFSNPQDRQKIADAMRAAIGEARKGAYFVSPNPLVGSVVLDRNLNVLQMGHHQKYGGPHAEVHAVAGLSSSQLEGATVVVTLEPCAHEGKTPSCAKMLAKLPVSRVIYGLQDPNPLVAGQGAQILRDAGKTVVLLSEEFPQETDLLEELEEVAEIFLFNFRKKKIWVSLKCATTLDGMIATKTGESKWITGPEARNFGHHLRATHDGIAVGAQTVIHDDPSLDIRLDGVQKENKVVVISRRGKGINPNSKVFAKHPADHIFVVVDEAFSKDMNLPSGVNKVALSEFSATNLLDELYRSGLRSLLIEGGAQTYAWFLETGWVNRLHLFQAPKLLGGVNGLHWSQGLQRPSLSDALPLAQTKVQQLGRDWYYTGRFAEL